MAFDLRKRARSFGYAFRGIGVVVGTQPNAVIHLVATVGVVALGIFVHLDRVEWCLLFFAMALVWVAEAVNTAIEFLADEVTLEQRKGIGRAKDVGAGAVLLAAIASAIIGAIVFVPHLLALRSDSGKTRDTNRNQRVLLMYWTIAASPKHRVAAVSKIVANCRRRSLRR